MRIAAAALLSAGAVLLADPALAAAEPSVQVVGGRERIKVSVAGTEYPADRCLVDPDADGNTQSIPMNGSGTMVVEGVAAGSRRVLVWCPQGGTIFQGHVDVQPGNPVLDMQDRVYAGAGSSARVTDPALR
ncbi:hypothetical protein JK358_04195 [Nocardia sp. 2]|uniref:Uncharacterized protein n=1 Tax=Nocardia acididurans TaxID=2802282 RepID=A0ABS1LZA3_9NOCA|nr:hypothetical protein [Nocardia acididurans]